MKRNYPEKLIDNEIREVRFFPANLQNKKPEKGVPFAVTCHPILNSLSKINRDNIYLLNMNEELSHQNYGLISKCTAALQLFGLG